MKMSGRDTTKMIGAYRLIVGAFVAAVLLAGCEEQKPPEKASIRPVRAMKVSDAAALQQRWFAGRAKATREIDLAFKVGGPLVAFDMKVGDVVGKGDLLGRIDPATYAADVAHSEASLERAKASLNNAMLEYERQNTLYEKGHVAKARVDNVTAQVQKNQADVAAEEAALKRAQLDLDYTNLRAPFSGIVVKTYVENFENIRAKQPTIRLVDSSRIEMIVDIPESLISMVPQVKETIAVFDAFPDRVITGTIKEIGTEASDTTRTYPVTLIMDQPEDIKILPGMAGKASASTPPQDVVAEAGVEIPVSATFTSEEPGSTFVWVIDETSKTVSQRRVRTGNLTDRGIKITEGLSPGEWIATAGVHYLSEGQQVKILAQ